MCFMTSMIGDGVAGAAAGSALPVIGTIAGGIGGIASGLLGMVGDQNANTANAEEQVAQQQFNLTMAQNQYQIATASMKAAGINPMLAYMQGGISVPTAPSYTNISTMDPIASSAQDMSKLPQRYIDATKQEAESEQEEAKASVAQPTANANMSTAQSQADQAQSTATTLAAGAAVAPQMAQATLTKAQVAANVQANTYQNQIDVANAQAAKAQSDADIANTDAQWSTFDHWNKAVATGSTTAKNIIEGFGVGKFLQGMQKNSGYRQWTPDGTPFDPRSGEVLVPKGE